MDGKQIDTIARAMATRTGRREVVRALAVGALGLLGLGAAGPAAARHGDCRHNDAPCRRGNQCCSGRCIGPSHDKKTCRPASGQGTCTIEQNSCPGLGDVFACGTESNPAIDCRCYVRANGASYCGGSQTWCHACDSDADCVGFLGQAEARCVQDCCPSTTGTACALPCPNPD